MEGLEKDIRFKYIFKEDYSPKYANGAYGGPTPKGDIVIHFFLERPPIPNYEDFDIDKKNGTLINRKTDPKELNKLFIRHIINGVTLNLEAAKSIHKWLGDIIQKIEISKMTKNGVKNDDSSCK